MNQVKRDKQNNLMITDDQAVTLFLDYVNNFITVTKFAEYLATSYEDARNIIDRGKIVHELRVNE